MYTYGMSDHMDVFSIVLARVFDSERETYQFTVCTNIQITKVTKKQCIVLVYLFKTRELAKIIR